MQKYPFSEFKLDGFWIENWIFSWINPGKIQFSGLSHYHMLFELNVNGTKWLVTAHPEIESINFTFSKMKKGFAGKEARIKKGWKRGTESRFESFWILSNSFESKTNRKSNNRIFRFNPVFLMSEFSRYLRFSSQNGIFNQKVVDDTVTVNR